MQGDHPLRFVTRVDGAHARLDMGGYKSTASVVKVIHSGHSVLSAKRWIAIFGMSATHAACPANLLRCINSAIYPSRPARGRLDLLLIYSGWLLHGASSCAGMLVCDVSRDS